MHAYELMVKKYLKSNGVNFKHIVLTASCHSVEDAAKAVNASINDFVKNICMIDQTGRLIIAIVMGKDRASTSRVGKALEIVRPRLAKEMEVLQYTGYPAGGVPSFGFEAIFLVDTYVMDMNEVYTGGGSPNSLVKVKVEDLVKMNGGKTIRVRK
ncbi:aminoacyl-tRNA deacylase [Bacillus solimangrovi]|uniref:YbaK/aminoacyl-tRNA synthetase-associated domain-containing protein n=1 Tax=Bacillus solimangrovi TaxID=1305675 RepID=A0A1E5LJ18_9BACI|nr:YbaK/EbsC family protein [Bacillus solimangrovi]OEH94075.1 hypothetical protein BFG57_09515 [Bacillus solimangrovi]